MCKRILNIRDNELYTYGEIGTRLNDYFIKNNLKVTNKHYELHLFSDLCKAEGLGTGKHKGYELLPVIQKEIERVKANQAKVKPAHVKPKKAQAITPIEEMLAKSARELEKAEAIITKAEPLKKIMAEKDPEPKAPDADDLETKRKKFYTDFHYFLKYAQTPEERTAIINALGSLYGLTKKEG